MTEINLRMKQKLNEVFSVEPNDLGINFLTFYFKKITFYLKTAPFIFVIPAAIIITLFLYFLLGKLLVGLVTILQYGY
jgi:hypothetical protein